MTPEQALQILTQLARMAPVNYESHAQGQQAAEVLSQFITSPEEPTKTKPKK